VSSPRDSHLFHFTRHFRAGLSYPAATRLEFWWCLLHRLRSMIVLTQSLKPASFLASDGAAEKPCPFKAISSSKPSMRQALLSEYRESLCVGNAAAGSRIRHLNIEVAALHQVGSRNFGGELRRA
jgi:hypothetical protein